jgi:amino acid permease
MDKLYKAIFTFVGTIVGAGVLGLPRAILESGFFLGLINMLLIGGVMLLISLMVGEVSLRTKDRHQIPGLVGKYVGKKTEYLVTILSIVAIYGALTAYIVGSGSLISNLLNVNIIVAELIYFIPLSIVLFFGLKGVENSESILAFFLIFSAIILSSGALFYLDTSNISTITPSNFFTPVGVIVFALSGMFAIPQMKEVLWLEKNKLKKSILIGFTIPLILYIFFTFSFIGACGDKLYNEDKEIATVCVESNFLFTFFGYLFAFLAMSTCFIALGNSLRETYLEDYKINKSLAFVLTIIPPLIVSFLGVVSFVELLSLTGGLFLIPLMIVLVYMYYKTRRLGERRPEYELKIPNWIIWLLVIFLICIMILVSWGSIINFKL